MRVGSNTLEKEADVKFDEIETDERCQGLTDSRDNKETRFIRN